MTCAACTMDTQCGMGTFCNGGTCGLKSPGAACTAADQCASGFCTDGVCCGQASCGTCRTCGAGGACVNIVGPAPAGQCADQGGALVWRRRQLRRQRGLRAVRVGHHVPGGGVQHGDGDVPGEVQRHGNLLGGLSDELLPVCQLQRQRLRLELRAGQRLLGRLLLIPVPRPSVCASRRSRWGIAVRAPACNAGNPRACAPLGTYIVGSDPLAIAFDGTNMWVTNDGGNDVTELSPTGATLGTFPVGTGRRGSRSTARTCGSPTGRQQRHRAVAERRDARHLLAGHRSGGDRVRRHEHVGHQLRRRTVTELSPTGATLGTFPVGTVRSGSRSTARTCGSPT